MQTEHKVRQGECISSIANKYGFFPETIWNDPLNKKLKKNREEGNILYPGDIVIIPGKRPKEESGNTEQRHRFRKKGTPSKLLLRCLDRSEPIANQPYILNIDGKVFEGQTDEDGILKETIIPSARSGKLIIGEPPNEKEFNLQLGALDPINTVTGVQERLKNLGFAPGKIDGDLSSRTKSAIRRFQEATGLKVTGELDKDTEERLSQEGA